MVVWWVAGVLATLWIVVYFIPDFLFHHLQWGAFFGSSDNPRVALTFDDGPGADTPALLETLRALEVRATFFVVSERCLRQPEVIRRLVEEGHEVGLHMKRHISAFLLAPWQSYRQIREGLDQIQRLTGKRPCLFRPPWGHVNLGTWLAIKRLGLTPVFWNIAPDDWRPDHTPDYISHYVVQLALPGSVVVLHDGGGNRTRTIQSLPSMVAGLRSCGLAVGLVSEISANPSMIRRVWTWWEIRFTRGWNIESIPNSGGGEPLLRIGHVRHHGPAIIMNQGRVLRRGDALGEIHFGNTALSQLSGSSISGLRALHGVRWALHDLADWVARHPDYDDIAAIGGVTLLDAARAIARLGFQHVPLRGWPKWSMRIYLIVLMSIYHHDGWRSLRRFSRLRPIMVVMDRAVLMSRYGSPVEKEDSGPPLQS